MAIYSAHLRGSRIIPLHALVFTHEADRYPDHERLDLLTLGEQLVGPDRRSDLAGIIYGELRHRITLKLSLGERVVLQFDAFTSDQRRSLAALAQSQGASVIETHTDETIHLVHALPRVDVQAALMAQGWQGITVIGDVHGDLARLEVALNWAHTRQHFVWLLGDVLDYGPQSLATADRAHQAVMTGDAAIVLANHERKIARWLDRSSDHLRISEGNKVTINALEGLSPKERAQWIGRFRAMLAHTALMQQIGSVMIMHAAAHPSLWETPDPQAIEQFALYGEADHSDGRYRRAHRWVDAVPEGTTVIVGHDIVSRYPMIVTGQRGGQVVFLDTGCGKGGQLSSADLRFSTTDLLRLECFKTH
jgi:hypothetical protein